VEENSLSVHKTSSERIKTQQSLSKNQGTYSILSMKIPIVFLFATAAVALGKSSYSIWYNKDQNKTKV
jgi:hypothetical protein